MKGGNPGPKDSWEQTPRRLTADKGQNSVIRIQSEAADWTIAARGERRELARLYPVVCGSQAQPGQIRGDAARHESGPGKDRYRVRETCTFVGGRHRTRNLSEATL